MELRVEDLRKSYGGTAVLQGVSFTAEIGLTRVTGSSGIGKTTLLRILLGLESPDGGTTNADRFRWAAVFQEDRLLEQLDAAGNLRFALGAAYDEAAARALLAELGLGDAGGKRVRDWSGGMKRRVGIAQALLNEPEVLILDEPTNGLDPSGIHEIRNLVKSLPSLYDCTVLISSHMLSEIELIADDIGILNHGRLLFEGSMNDLRQYALQSGFAADNLEDVFLSMVEKDNMDRKQRAKL